MVFVVSSLPPECSAFSFYRQKRCRCHQTIREVVQQPFKWQLSGNLVGFLFTAPVMILAEPVVSVGNGWEGGW